MSSFYTPGGPFTLENWNLLIRAVNEKLTQPPENTTCQAIDALEEVTPPHRWSRSDIRAVRAALEQTCQDIEFTEDLTLWRQAIIDEIETQMEQAWCDCEPEHPDFETQTLDLIRVGCTDDRIIPLTQDALLTFWQLVADTRQAAGQWRSNKYYQCDEELKLQAAEDELQSMQLSLEELQNEANDACNTPGMEAQCDSLLSEIDALNIAIAAQEADIVDIQAQRDNYRDLADTYLAAWESGAAECSAAQRGYNFGIPAFIFLDNIDSRPAKNTDCENFLTWRPGTPGKFCSWTVTSIRIGGQYPQYYYHAYGGFTLSGTPYPTGWGWTPAVHCYRPTVEDEEHELWFPCDFKWHESDPTYAEEAGCLEPSILNYFIEYRYT